MKIVESHRGTPTGQRPRVFCYAVVAVLSSLAWGSLAFGAVYPWAYWPLLVLSVVAGVLGFLRQRRSGSMSQPLAVGLLVLIGAVLLQLMPLPAAVVRAVSPSSERIVYERQLADPALATAAAYPLSVDPRSTMRGLAFVTAFGVLLLGTCRSLASRDIRLVVRGVAAISVTLALIGMAQKGTSADKVYGLWQPYYDAGMFGPFLNRNHFAGWMIMAIPLVVGYCCGHLARSLSHVAPTFRDRVLWFSSPEANEMVLMAIGVLLMALSLVMTLSRSGMTCLALAMVMFGLTVARRQVGRRRVLLIVYLLLAGVAAVAWAGTGEVVDRFTATDVQGLAGRRRIWLDAAHIVRQFPLVGSGLNTYGTARAFYVPNPDFTAVEAHNDYLQLAAEGGVLVVGAAAAFLLLFAREVKRRLRECAAGSTDFWVRFGAVVGLLSIGFQEVVEFSLQMPGNAALFVVLCAVAVHPTQSR